MKKCCINVGGRIQPVPIQFYLVYLQICLPSIKWVRFSSISCKRIATRCWFIGLYLLFKLNCHSEIAKLQADPSIGLVYRFGCTPGTCELMDTCQLGSFCVFFCSMVCLCPMLHLICLCQQIRLTFWNMQRCACCHLSIDICLSTKHRSEKISIYAAFISLVCKSIKMSIMSSTKLLSL